MSRNESPKKTDDNKMKIDPWINVSPKRKILYLILLPFFVLWFGFCWLLMQIGKWIFKFGVFLSGNSWNVDH